MGLLHDILVKFVKPDVLVGVHGMKLLEVDYANPENQVDDLDLLIDWELSQKLQSDFDEGDLSQAQLNAFYRYDDRHDVRSMNLFLNIFYFLHDCFLI